MLIDETRYTKNRIVLAYAEIRYNVGLFVSRFMEERGMTEGVWRPLFYWAYGSEGRYNCLIEPELGKRIREETLQQFFMYLSQYKGKGSYVGHFYWSVPVAYQISSRLKFVQRWVKKQSMTRYRRNKEL